MNSKYVVMKIILLSSSSCLEHNWVFLRNLIIVEFHFLVCKMCVKMCVEQVQVHCTQFDKHEINYEERLSNNTIQYKRRHKLKHVRTKIRTA